MHKPELARRFVEGILSLAELLNKPLMVDGVENRDQYALLRRAGHETFHGPYVGDPMTPEQAGKFIVRYKRGG